MGKWLGLEFELFHFISLKLKNTGDKSQLHRLECLKYTMQSVNVFKNLPNNKVSVISLNRYTQIVRTLSEVVLVVCLFKKLLFQNVIIVL